MHGNGRARTLRLPSFEKCKGARPRLRSWESLGVLLGASYAVAKPWRGSGMGRALSNYRDMFSTSAVRSAPHRGLVAHVASSRRSAAA